MVTPAPSSWQMHQDGEGSPRIPEGLGRTSLTYITGGEPRTPPASSGLVRDAYGKQYPIGFCRSTKASWECASRAVEDHVFWLEHDFEFLRPVDLRELASILDRLPHYAQMALMRDAVNSDEIAAGGLYELRRDEYTPLDHWLSHRSYLTTNPSLMRTDFLRENPWPGYDSECEGRFGIDLVAAGYQFGAWGSGEPWVRHIGERTGHGY